MLSCKAFATNSLKLTFVWDVWFDGQIIYSKIEHLSNIDETRVGTEHVEDNLFLGVAYNSEKKWGAIDPLGFTGPDPLLICTCFLK